MTANESDPAGRQLKTLASSMDFPVTVCAICYGQNVGLARRFLASLYEQTPAALFHLRAGLNEVEPATRELFEQYAAKHQNIELFIEATNVFKCPLMRRLFHEQPLSSGWTIWCDDDTHFIQPDWLHRLSETIRSAPDTGQWGKLYVVQHFDDLMLDWIRAASWYRGMPPLRGLDAEGNPVTEIRFATGGFWAIRTAILQQLDWPDPRLVQAYDDFLLGEALRQNRLSIGEFDYGVRIDDAPRRNPAAAEVRFLPR